VGQISFVVYSDHEECAGAFAQLLEQTAHARAEKVIWNEEELQQCLRDPRADALLLDLGPAPHLVLDMLESLASCGPAIFVSGPQDDSQLILRALKLGVREFFPPVPDALELEAAVERLLIAQPQPAATGHEAPILAVMGAKGGVGATVVTCQLAATLQRGGARVGVVDLNCPLGDVALHLDLRPPYTLASVLTQTDEFDITYLRSLLEEHSSGLQVLAAPERVEENELVRGEHVERVLSVLRRDVDWVVVDVARSWNEASVRVLDLASEILLVTSLDVTALAHTRQHLDLLRRLGHGDDKIHLVANRHNSADAVTDGDFAEFVGRPYDVALPNAYARAVEAVNSGRTLAQIDPKGELTGAFERFASDVHRWCRVDTGSSDPDEDRTLGRRVRQLFGR
jgi:pilus assembly protein CpaE